MARYARIPETTRRQVSAGKDEQKERKLQPEASSLTVDVLRQLEVVLPKLGHLVRDHLEPVGHLGELSVYRLKV
jgi:hypothetical protein